MFHGCTKKVTHTRQVTKTDGSSTTEQRELTVAVSPWQFRVCCAFIHTFTHRLVIHSPIRSLTRSLLIHLLTSYTHSHLSIHASTSSINAPTSSFTCSFIIRPSIPRSSQQWPARIRCVHLQGALQAMHAAHICRACICDIRQLSGGTPDAVASNMIKQIAWLAAGG